MAERFDLAAYLEAEGERVEAALERVLADTASLVAPTLRDAVRHGVLSEGKRLRPVLCVAAYRACGGEGDAIHELAAALELIHAYSLVHDDLPSMDAADLRRGRPTTWRVHGEGAATWAGAALIPIAVLAAWRGARAAGRPYAAGAVALELARAAGAGGMVGGQALDLRAEGRRLDEGALDRLHRLKTGALLTAALRMGGIAAGADAEALAALATYGRSIGLAFQIADDVLDATATAAELGKNPSDAELGKSTYVTLHGPDAALARARGEVARARAALAEAGIDAPALHALAEHVVARRR